MSEIRAYIERAIVLLRIAAARMGGIDGPPDPLRALYVTAADVDEILVRATAAPAPVARTDRFAPPELERLRLDPFSCDVVALCAALEVVPRLDRVIGFLHDDTARRSLTLSLALQICGVSDAADPRDRIRFGPRGALQRLGLIELSRQDAALGDGVRLDPGFLSYLLGESPLDDRLRPWSTVRLPRATETDAPVAVVRTGAPVVLWGAPAEALRDAAHAAASVLGMPVLYVGACDPDLWRCATRDAMLAGAVLALAPDGADVAARAAQFFAQVPVHVLIEAPAGIAEGITCETFRVRARRAERSVPSPSPLPYGRRIAPRRGFDDLVLPAQRLQRLAALVNRVRKRDVVFEDWHLDAGSSAGGVRGLFAGPPGTGKSLAAEAVASELDRDLYVIDISAVISKYIGETEKILANVFSAAARAGVVLFFDEADAVFAKRNATKDAHDRYANLETSYLLQAIDAYPDVVLLATNLLENIDHALLRRIDVRVDFPMPDAAARELLWRRSLADAPAERQELADLARRFPLSGGGINTAVLNAAFAAAGDERSITALDLVRGARNELTKSGRVAGRAELGAYFDELRSEA